MQTCMSKNAVNCNSVTVELPTCGCKNNMIFSKKICFNGSYRRCMPRTLAWQQAGLDRACQSGNIVDLIVFRV